MNEKATEGSVAVGRDDSDKTPSAPHSTAGMIYRVLGVVFGIVGVALPFFYDFLPWAQDKESEYTLPAGIAVFGVLYVIAQAVERIVEWVTAGLKLIKDSPGAQKDEKKRQLRLANSTIKSSPTRTDITADTDGGDTPQFLAVTVAPSAEAATASTDKKMAEVTIDERRTDVFFLAQGLAILLASYVVCWMDYGIMQSLGAPEDFDKSLDRLLTALAAAGGSTALHELVGRVQAQKEKDQTAA